MAFSALGDETRWQILVRLGGAASTASQLAEHYPISRQAIVRHLEILRGAGLVDTEKVGREVLYRALGEKLSSLGRDLDRIGREWDRRLARIKALAEEHG